MRLKVKKGKDMKMISGVLGSLGAVGVILALAIAIGAIAMTVYGVILAFKASILLGILVLFVEPSPFIIGLVMFATNINLAEKLVQWFNSL